MKRFLKWLALTLAALVLVLAVLGINAWWFKPFTINTFYNRVFIKFALSEPELLTSLGLVEQFGIKGHQGQLTDISDAFETEQINNIRDELATLHRYDRKVLDADAQLSYDVLENFLAMQVEGERWRYHNYPVNQLFGVQNELPSFLLSQHPVGDARDARDYVKRLQAFDTKFAQLIEGLKLRELRGIIPPRFVVEKVLSEMIAFTGKPALENPLYSEFAKKLAAAKAVDEVTAQQILADTAKAIDETVYPAYRSLIAYFVALQPRATTNNGVWALPEGDAFYAFAVRDQTTTSLTPDEVHEIGLAEVARIEAEMDALLKKIGYAEGSIGSRMEALQRTPEQLYPDSDAGREQILKDYQSIIDEINAGMGAAFDVRAKLGVQVKRIPVFKEATAPGAYYEPGAFDGSRPGVFYANLHDMKEQPRLGMRTLSYHEAVPGHHFQITVAQELTGVPFFRKVLPFTAYVEGWALYAERLAWEMGYFKEVPSDLGRLQAEMFRAVRLVVDTGMHRKRWTREQSIAYMREKTGMGEKEVTSEIERYLVSPGQALAYKLGMLKILEVREMAKRSLGPKFDLKAFHNLVLKGGALPLPLLEKRVKDWVAAQK